MEGERERRVGRREGGGEYREREEKGEEGDTEGVPR